MRHLIVFSVILHFFLSPVYALEKLKDDEAKLAYHVWYHPDPAEENSLAKKLDVTTHVNNTFYHVMELAAETDPQYYSFEAEEFPFGHYVTSIGGVSEDPTNNLFWMVYKLESTPDPSKTPGDELLSPVGIDAIRVNHGDIYLFWRKAVIIEFP